MSLVFSQLRSPVNVVKSMLSDIGFSPRDPRKVMSLELGDGILGFVDLRATNFSGNLSVYPAVGVSEKRMGEVLSELLQSEFVATSSLFIGANLGQLTPDNNYRAYDFEAGGAHEQRARELVEDVRLYALPFFESHRTLQAILQTMLASEYRGVPSFYIPVGHYVNGDYKSALASLNKQIAKYGDQPSPALEYYKMFAERLMKRIEFDTN